MSMPLLNETYGLDGKKYYIYVPGTTHYDEDRFGNPKYVYDMYYLDSKFNKFIMQTDKDDIEKFADKYKKAGNDVFVGPHAPETEDINGDYVPFTNPNLRGIWERPTKEQLLTYKEIIKRDREEEKNIKKLA